MLSISQKTRGPHTARLVLLDNDEFQCLVINLKYLCVCESVFDEQKKSL